MHRRAAYRVLALMTPLIAAPPVGAQWRHLGPVTGYERQQAVLTLRCGQAAVRVQAVNEHVVRIRLAPEGTFGRDFSWAVQKLKPRGKFVAFEETDELLRASTGALTVTVRRRPCRLEITDAAGHVLIEDEAGRGMAWRATRKPSAGGGTAPGAPGAVRVWQRMPDGTAIYGLGEKTGPLNKRARAWTMWNTDAWGYGRSTDPIYKSIPFFISVRDGIYHGVFFDNPWRTSFDFGKEDRAGMSFGAEGGALNYYVIGGPDPKDVIRRYTDLVGRMELPPKWAIGYHQCRHSYFPESRIREIAVTFREKKIPCDVIYFDIAYMDGYRCFTWDPQKFPDPAKLTGDLRALGFHTVAIIDPGIKRERGYFVYDQGEEIGAWLTGPDGGAYVGRVWPGDTVFPDFTNPKVRRWWSGLFPAFLTACGIDGIWNDMNEPADFIGPHKTVPLDLRHDNEGEPASHRACHNIYGMQMARATLAGIQAARPEQRAFTLTRATYAGGQRYGAGWTGDNLSTWEHLRMSIPMVLGLGVSGMPFVGPDIGGYSFGARPELYARWIQVGSLYPFCRTHTGWDSPDQEPWSFGPEVETIAKEALERRYALLPYLYTLFEEASRTGIPIMRPLWLEFSESGRWEAEHTFLLGALLYVVPRMNPDPLEFPLRLPRGVWFDYHTGARYDDGQEVTIAKDLKTLPLFVRAGAIIPTQSSVQSTTFTPDEPLILEVWPLGESTGTLYEDDGETRAYLKGVQRRTRFRCAAAEGVIAFTMFAPTGRYTPPARTPLVRFHSLSGAVKSVRCSIGDEGAEGTRIQNGAELPRVPGSFHYDADTRTCVVRMHPDTGREQTVRLQLEPPPAGG